MNNLFLAISMLSIFFLISCEPNYFYEKSFEINNDGWAYADTLNFEVEITDTLKIYNLYLDIEHTTDYTKQNMYVMIYTQFPSGERIKERVSIDFADKTGKWYGECNNAKCDLRVNIQKDAFFNLAGKHSFTIEQFMRIDPLPGIINVALRIEDTGQRRNLEN